MEPSPPLLEAHEIESSATKKERKISRAGSSGSTAHEGQSLLCPSQFSCLWATEVHEQTFRSGGQSDVKSPVFSSQASLILIQRPAEGVDGSVDLAQPRASAPDLWYNNQSLLDEIKDELKVKSLH
ncbi:hypothetical protein TNCV_186361 [Trichonephila clavipes]|nr:hypothetical protein TNCV_186361 [Trichonephila clavipes]